MGEMDARDGQDPQVTKKYKKQHLYRIKCDSRPIKLTHVSFCVTLGSVRCAECQVLLLLFLSVLLIGFR